MLEALEDCLKTVNRLEDLIKKDREDMPGCINGEVLEAYLQGLDAVQDTVDSLQTGLRKILAGE